MKLFHTIAVPHAGDVLDFNRHAGHQAEEYLFAAENEAMSACYSIPHGGKYAVDMDAAGRISLFIPESTLESWNDLNAIMYSFPDAGFKPHGEKPKEWISTMPVQLKDAKIEHRIQSLTQIMQLGVQLYAVSAGADLDAVLNFQDHETMNEHLKSGAIRWLNKDTGINLVPVASPQSSAIHKAGITMPHPPSLSS